VRSDGHIEVQEKPTEEQLLKVHSKAYLESLNSSYTVATITEIPIVAVLPNAIVWWRVLNPMLYATAGSIAGAYVAAIKGWAINLGGGFHHCSGTAGGGFCPFADITLAVVHLRIQLPAFRRVLIVDLDAHQGNGHERDFTHDVLVLKTVYIFDLYSSPNYPSDYDAKRAISCGYPLPYNTDDVTYMRILTKRLPESLEEFKPDIIYYNAGTDCLKGDPIGALGLSANCIIQRDEFVFENAFKRNTPIVMVLSGGYQQNNARVIADSIINLDKKFHIINTVP